MDPTIHPGNGTTDELRRELERLRRELAELPEPEEVVVEEIKRLLEALRRRKEYLRLHETDPDTDEEVVRLEGDLERARAKAVAAAVLTHAEWLKIARARRSIAKLELRLGERGSSTLVDCHVSLVFDGSKLVASDGSSWPAVSGLPDAAGKFDYSKASQRKEGSGPIPEGHYWVDPCQVRTWRTSPLAHVVARSAWGSASVAIHPFDATPTLGRGGFFIHGGDTPGSKGCIDLTSHMDNFAKWMEGRKLCAQRCKIQLKVAYP